MRGFLANLLDVGTGRGVVLVKLALSAILAIALGFVGLSFYFSDLGPGESWTRRNVETVLFFVACGFLLGAVNRRMWPVSAIVSWASVVFGIAGMMASGMSAYAAWTLFGSIGLALLGGWCGRLAATVAARRFEPSAA